jgi:hypothetical protein
MPEFDFEEGFDRLEAAMGPGGSGATDVPFIAQMHEFAMAYSGARGDVFYSDAETLVRGILTTSRDLGFDTPSFIWDAYNVEAEALGVPLVTFEDMAPALDNLTPLIRDETDLARLKAPDPATAGRMPFVAEVLHLGKELTGRRPYHGFCAPFTMAAHLMTFENLIVQIKQNPAFVHKVMDFIVDEVLAPYCRHATWPSSSPIWCPTTAPTPPPRCPSSPRRCRKNLPSDRSCACSSRSTARSTSTTGGAIPTPTTRRGSGTTN